MIMARPGPGVRARQPRAPAASSGPVLRLSSLRATRAFLATRRLLLLFGGGFHSRLVVVTAANVVIVAGAAAFAVASTVLSGDAPTLYAALVLLHVLVLPAAAIVYAGLWTATAANEAATWHANVVVEARLDLRFQLHDARKGAAGTGVGAGAGREAELGDDDWRGYGGEGGADKGGGRAHEVLPLLIDVERSLRAQQEEAPVTFFGIPASAGLAQSFFGAWLSVEMAVTSLAIGRFVGGGMK